MKYTKTTLSKLEQLIKEINYVLRYEKGNFNSGYCIVENNKIIIVNKFFDTETRINVLIDIISTLELDETKLSEKTTTFMRQFLKPILSAENT